MGRVRRPLVNLLTIVSVVLCAAGGALWARSYFVQDIFLLADREGHSTLVAHSSAGSFVLFVQPRPGGPVSVDYFTNSPSAFAPPVTALITFRYDPNFATPIIVFPQWTIVAFAAPLPIARFYLWRRRGRRAAGRGFPVDAATTTA